MGKKQSKNRVTKNPKHKTLYKSIRTRRRTKDIDQIQDEMVAVAENPQLNTRALDYDLPGMGQHYCLCCARYFIDSETLAAHNASKVHKKRLKVIAQPQYTLEEAEAAVGMAPAKKT